MKTIETYAPIFKGFYGNHWEMDETPEIESYNEEYGTDLDWDNFEWDNKQYMNDVCQKFCEVLTEKLHEIMPSIKTVKMQEIRSPQFYNFSNDAIDVEIIGTNKMMTDIRRYLKYNSSEWDKYLKVHYTHYSGFWSSYPNTADGWKNDTENYNEVEGHYLGSILQFICDNEGLEEFEDFYYEVMEGIYISEYMERKAS